MHLSGSVPVVSSPRAAPTKSRRQPTSNSAISATESRDCRRFRYGSGATLDTAQGQLQVVRVGRRREHFFFPDQPGFCQLDKGLIEGLHAVVASLRHGVRDLVKLILLDAL